MFPWFVKNLRSGTDVVGGGVMCGYVAGKTVMDEQKTPTTLVISDTHLAHPGVKPGRRINAEHLRPLWQGVERLVIAGDLAELQLVDARAEASRQVEALATFCEEDGVELAVVSGNHDAFLTDQRHVDLLGGRVFVMHGDALHPSIAPWSCQAHEMALATEEAMQRDQDEHAGEPADLRRRLQVVQHVAHQQFLGSEHGKAHGWVSALMRPDRVAMMAWFWRVQPDLASSFMERFCPNAEVLIFGHSHYPGVWQRAGKTIINTGSFVFPCRPRAVLLQGTAVSVHRIIKGKDGMCGLQDKALWSQHLQTEAMVQQRAA